LCHLVVRYILLPLSSPEQGTNPVSPPRFATTGEATRQNIKLSLQFFLTFLLYLYKFQLLRRESTGYTAAAWRPFELTLKEKNIDS